MVGYLGWRGCEFYVIETRQRRLMREINKLN